MRVLLLLDANDPVHRIEEALLVRGHSVSTAATQLALEDPLAEMFASADLVIADGELAARARLIERLATTSPGIEFILVGGNPGPTLPADVLAQFDRPVDLDRLLRYVDELADILDGERLREPTDLVAYETLFAGDSPQILNLVRRVRLVARSDAPVWVFGEDGSGRAIIARAIHDRSSRRNQPFIALNTAAHSDEELTSLLFVGDDAACSRASRGTIFLEQIENAGPNLQRALVQFLDKKRSDDKESISTRLIVGVPPPDPNAGPHRAFSTDLYYRLKVLEVEIPRLCDRARDLEQIVVRMVARLASDGHAPSVSTDTLRLLSRYSFPGNLLELAHALTHAFVVAHGNPIEPYHLPPSIREPFDAVEADGALQTLDSVAKRFERDYLLRVLRSVGGSRQRAADILGISRKGLWAKLKGHGITDDDIDESDASAS